MTPLNYANQTPLRRGRHVARLGRPCKSAGFGRTSSVTILALVVGLSLWTWISARAEPAETVAWQTDYQQALSLAAKSGKPVFLDFTATWCPPCQQMKKEVFPKPAVSEILSTGFVAVKMDVSLPDGPNTPVATQFNVEGLPTLIVVGSDGKVISRREAFQSEEELLAWLKPLAAHAATQPAASAAPHAR